MPCTTAVKLDRGGHGEAVSEVPRKNQFKCFGVNRDCNDCQYCHPAASPNRVRFVSVMPGRPGSSERY